MIVHDRRNNKEKTTSSQPNKNGLGVAADRIAGQPVGGAADKVDNLFGKLEIKKALYQAAIDGRLHESDAELLGVEAGQYSCGVCGMRASTLDLADRCCLDEGNHRGLFTDKQNGSYGAAAVVRDQQSLINALAGYALDRNIKTRRALVRETGMSISTLTRIQTHVIRWINEPNWETLLSMFDGAVPGCEVWPIVEVDHE